MSIESDFVALLAAYTPLTALVPAAHIAQNGVTPGVDVPYIVFNVTRTPEFGLDNTLLAMAVSFRVECWGETSLDADAVADQVEAALLADARVCTSRQTAADPDVGLHATVLQAEWWAD